MQATLAENSPGGDTNVIDQKVYEQADNAYLDILLNMRDRFSPVVFWTFMAMQAILFGGFGDVEAKQMGVQRNQTVVGQEFCSLNSRLRSTPDNLDEDNVLDVLENQIVQLTGEQPVESGGYTWVRIQLPGTESFGYVAFETLRASSLCSTTSSGVVTQSNIIDIHIREVISIFHNTIGSTPYSIPHDDYSANYVAFVLPRLQDNIVITNMGQDLIIFLPNTPTLQDNASRIFRDRARIHLPENNVTGYTICTTTETGREGAGLISAATDAGLFFDQATEVFGTGVNILVSSMIGARSAPGSGTYAVLLECQREP